jgi:hypothetical protein
VNDDPHAGQSISVAIVVFGFFGVDVRLMRVFQLGDHV